MTNYNNNFFDMDRSVRGFGNRLTMMTNDLALYADHLAEKGKLRVPEQLRTILQEHLTEEILSRNIRDPFLQLLRQAESRLTIYKSLLCDRWEIREEVDYRNPLLLTESYRFNPCSEKWNQTMTDRMMRHNTLKMLKDITSVLYHWACAFHLQSYQIPDQMIRDFDASEEPILQGAVNVDALWLVGLICHFKKDIDICYQLLEKNGAQQWNLHRLT